ncbi:ribose 1,5-bisphosphate isomerase [Pyrofollis japonicus]|nr:ribose 1,5-bisphosphate isomerase [Pyrofollis japonicus]
MSGFIGRVRGLGATEASELVIKEFRRMIENAASVSDVLEALDYLKARIEEYPFSALLVNVAREVFGALAERKYKSLEEAKNIIIHELDDTMRAVLEETEGAAEIAARRLSDGDIVLTYGYSRSVIRALEKAAAMGKKIRVIVAESRPLLDGLEAAKVLVEKGFDTTLIVDSAMRFFAREATKALIGADAVMADGSVVSRTGSGLLALVANEARVRLIVVAGSYKLYPETVYGLTVETPALGDEIVPEDLRSLGVQGYAPLFEIIPSHLIDALATERGLVAPEAVPLIIKEIYGEWPPELEPLDNLVARASKRVMDLGEV